MEQDSPINSESYWDSRFSDDWQACEGPRQSRFFARLAVDNLPSWLIEQIRRQFLRLADWGCAQGDGTDIWASYLNSQQLVGVDFSAVAIEQATKRYPAIRFVSENWLEAGVDACDSYDVVFSSNTLEHFHNPYEVLEALGERAKKAVVLALPYRELERIGEHFYSFLPDNVPLVLSNGFRLVWSRVVDCRGLPNTQWPGDQIFLVYAETSWVDSLKLSLRDCEIGQDDTASEIASVSQEVVTRDGQIASLNQEVVTRDGQIASLNQEVVTRDGQIASLNQEVVTRDGQIASLNQEVVTRDGQIASLNLEVVTRDGQIASLNKDLYMIKQSTSWRVTSPFRVAKNLIKAPKRTAYQVLRSFFWRLPASLRQRLHGPRHAFVRFVRGLQKVPTPSKGNVSRLDMSWPEFNKEILSKREKYKGIFVQELVIDWNVPLYQRPQHIAAALGRLGYLVIYRTDNWAGDNVDGFREVSENVWITNRYEVDEIHDIVRSFYSTAYAHTPELLLKNGKRGTLIYEYIDHIDPEISGDRENVRRLVNLQKFAFEGGAEFIVASAKKLYDEAVSAVGKDKVLLVPNGVDTVHYRNPAHRRTVLPDSLLEFKAKHQNIVGYFGALAPWLWYECIQELAAARPELGFVFIGPDYYGGAEKLPRLSNIIYLGTIDYKILPAYALQFDICFIPFKPGDIAKTTSPLKLFEYFALEKPVVVTADMNECTAFPEVFRGSSASELSEALDAALQVLDHEPFKVRLRELADQNDWTQRALAYEPVFKDIKSKSLIADLSKVFQVGNPFIEQYKKNNSHLNWDAGSAESFLDGMSGLSRMYVEFAMSCVLRGQSMATLIDSTGLIRNRSRYLDVGTGYGGFPVAFAQFGFSEVVGVELQDHLVQLSIANTVTLPNATILKRNIVEDNIDDLGTFDLITCNDVIEHVSDPAITIQKLASMLNLKGVLSLEIPNKNCISFVISDGHFQLFAITLLEREDAADYYAEVLNTSTKEYYLQEMGHSYALEWYWEQLNQRSVVPALLDTHQVCNFSDFPVQLKLFEERFQKFKKESRSKLSSAVFENVERHVNDYIEQANNEYESAKQSQDKNRFVDKYLRTFWTVIGIKN